jgi:peptidoglycan/xylan/chitin deacetylase (PgdA/CDA1 family)
MLIPAALAALGTGALVSYGAISSTSQLFGAAIAHIPLNQTALTFDDGPNGDTTLRLLDILAAADARATFFLIGKYVRRQPDIVRRIHAAGHAIGNHTESHPNLFWTSPKHTRAEIVECQNALEDIIGAAVRLFRPPYGARRPNVLATARQLGLTPVLWNVKCFDWAASATPDTILNYAERRAAHNRQRGRGSIILLHDGGHLQLNTDRTASLAATQRILALAHARGERFVTLTDAA